jgi:hypothetical protein
MHNPILPTTHLTGSAFAGHVFELGDWVTMTRPLKWWERLLYRFPGLQDWIDERRQVAYRVIRTNSTSVEIDKH